MKKIAYLLQSFHLGGIETAIMNLATYLKPHFEFHFIATNNPIIHPQFIKNGTAVYMGERWDKITKYLHDQKIDVVQFGNRIEYKNCAIKAEVPYIIERTSGPRSLGLDKYGVNHVIASARGALTSIKNNYSGPTSLIYNGFDLTQPITPHRLFDHKAFIVCSPTARIGEGQNYSMLIKAVIKARKSNPNIKLILMGDYPKHAAYPNIVPQLKKQASVLGDSCVWTGFMLDPNPIIAGSDCVVIPAKSHGISNGLISGAMLSKPLISTQVGWNDEICRPDNGFMIKLNDIDTMAERILQLSLNPILCEEMGNAGRSIVEKDFNISIQAEKYRSLYMNEK